MKTCTAENVVSFIAQQRARRELCGPIRGPTRNNGRPAAKGGVQKSRDGPVKTCTGACKDSPPQRLTNIRPFINKQHQKRRARQLLHHIRGTRRFA